MNGQPYIISAYECRPFIETAQWHDTKVAFCIIVGLVVLIAVLMFISSIHHTNVAYGQQANDDRPDNEVINLLREVHGHLPEGHLKDKVHLKEAELSALSE